MRLCEMDGRPWCGESQGQVEGWMVVRGEEQVLAGLGADPAFDRFVFPTCLGQMREEKERMYDTVHARMEAAERQLNELKMLSEHQAAALMDVTNSEKILQVGPRERRERADDGVLN